MKGNTSKVVEILRDGEVVLIAASQSEAANILRVGYKVIIRYMNHILPVSSPLLGRVNIQ